MGTKGSYESDDGILPAAPGDIALSFVAGLDVRDLQLRNLVDGLHEVYLPENANNVEGVCLPRSFVCYLFPLFRPLEFFL